ncbi:MAG: hypothetical protein QXW06_07780 [Thermoplasmata archaeon]
MSDYTGVVQSRRVLEGNSYSKQLLGYRIERLFQPLTWTDIHSIADVVLLPGSGFQPETFDGDAIRNWLVDGVSEPDIPPY